MMLFYLKGCTSMVAAYCVVVQEVRRREAAEAEVSEAQGYLNSSRQELGELKHLAWKLEQMGRNRY